jgi:membrane-associated protease RseP (regulator of RpoE activity)
VDQRIAEDSPTATERALIAAGVAAADAADIRRRSDELTLDELYLRDQAEREQWLDTPRFREELAEIERWRPSIRDDRYLAALGEPNRVSVEEVLLDSAAAQAGLRAGDVVLRYGEARIFNPGELVAETRGGNAGESVRLEILRGGERLEIEVPRGPLGLRIAASHGNPGES